MNSLKRIFVSMKSQIDHVADEFENHEALAGVAIQDLQTMASKTRLHLHRISKMSEQYDKQLQTLQEQADLWSSRAIKAKQEDEQKALQCVKRLRQTRQQITALEKQYQDNTVQESKIRDDLNAIQNQLESMKNKKEILAARQNRTNVQDILQHSQGGTLQEAQNIFERWEGTVVGSEFDIPEPIIDADHFAKEFEQEEDNLALKKMLDELTEPELTEPNSSSQNIK